MKRERERARKSKNYANHYTMCCIIIDWLPTQTHELPTKNKRRLTCHFHVTMWSVRGHSQPTPSVRLNGEYPLNNDKKCWFLFVRACFRSATLTNSGICALFFFRFFIYWYFVSICEIVKQSPKSVCVLELVCAMVSHRKTWNIHSLNYDIVFFYFCSMFLSVFVRAHARRHCHRRRRRCCCIKIKVIYQISQKENVNAFPIANKYECCVVFNKLTIANFAVFDADSSLNNIFFSCVLFSLLSGARTGLEWVSEWVDRVATENVRPTDRSPGQCVCMCVLYTIPRIQTHSFCADCRVVGLAWHTTTGNDK